MKSQRSWDNFFMKFAYQCAELSYDPHTKVGCVITSEDQILSYSYNGTPRGYDNSCKDENGKTKREVIHAEVFAIGKLARSTVSADRATLYCTLAPCIECAKLIIASGIRRVVYGTVYKDTSGVELMKASGVNVYNLNSPYKDEHSLYADPEWLTKTGIPDEL